MFNAAWKKNLAVLWSAQCVGMSAITGVVAFLPLYVAELGVSGHDASAMWSGVLVGSASFTAALSNPYWGAMADRKGRKPMVEKVLLLFGLIILAMAFVANVYQLLALRTLQGLCGGFVAASTALAVSMSPPEEISFTVGIFQTSLIVGGAAGPMVGGLIADAFGYRRPFVVFAGLCLLALLVIHFAVTEKFTPVPKGKAPSLKETLRFVWSIGELRLMLLIQFFTQFAIQSIGPILPLYIQSMIGGANIASISGGIIAVAGITSAVASASMGRLSRRFSHKQILIAAALLGSVTFIGQLAADSVVLLAVLRALNGLCIGAMIPSSNTIITYLIPETKRGAAYGITSGAALMGNVLGPLSAGALSLLFGISAIFWLTAVLFALIAALLSLQLKEKPQAGCPLKKEIGQTS